MSRALLLTLCAALACGGDDDGVPPAFDAGPEPAPDAAADVPGCVPAAQRETATVIVSGRVIDFATRDPVIGAQVEVNTAWDIAANFPEDCPPLATLTTDTQGRFGPETVAVGSPELPPFVIFLVGGGDRAPTASDQRLIGCEDGGDCGNLGHTIAAPSAALGDDWRAELEADGMPEAGGRGLVLFEYRDLQGASAGVVPTRGQEAPVDLVPATEVRFLAADRSDLMPAVTTATTASGVAIIGIDHVDHVAYVGGHEGERTWQPTGVLIADGWFFLEDKLGPP
jgi:hypothetical protein